MKRVALTTDETLEASGLWWLILVIGIASAAAGVIIVARPSHSLKTLAVVAGIFLLLDGIAELITAFGRDREDRALRAIGGLLGVIIGIVLIRHPFTAVNAIGLLIGIWLVAIGGIRLVQAIVVRVQPVLRSLIALVEIVFGVAIVSDPHIGYTALAIVTGILFIANGIGLLALALAVRTLPAERPGSP
jgi:uncharacterized membrane protein HdeD (DUF308 family)